MIINHHGEQWSEKPVETELNGKVVWTKYVAFGNPATTVRRNYYSTYEAAAKGNIADDRNDNKKFLGSDNVYE